MANVTNDHGVFSGLSELHVIKDGFGAGFTVPQGGQLVEVPVAEDSGFTYSGGTPSVDRYRIHGLSTPWAMKTTPGDAEISLFIPQVTKELLELFGFESVANTTATILSKNWTGVTFKDSAHEVVLGLAAINRTQDQLFGIKFLQGLASLVFDDANSAKPIGIQLTGSTASGGDADAMGIFEIVPSE